MTMKSVDLPHLRSVVLAGHAGAGKTTLAEQLLFKAGAIPRLGRVDDGTAHLDFEPEEQKRRESLSLAVGTFESRRDADLAGRHARLPGLHRRRHRGLRRRRRRDLRDGRLGAASRPASSTRSRSAARTGTAACFFINKCDRENADPTRRPRRAAGDASATRSRRSSSRSARPSRSRATSTSSTARRGGWDGTTEVEIPIPDDLADEVARRRDQLLEAAAEADDDVLTKYLEGEEISDPELEACLRKGVKEIDPRAGPRRQRDQGHRPARRCSTRSCATSPPRPTSRRPRPPDKAGATVEVAADENGPLLVRVFKTTADPFVGRLTYLRVLSGTLHSQAHVWNSTPERGRADRPAAAAPRQGAGADRRAQGRRDRRGRQADRDRDRRHARVAREAADPAAARRSPSRR